MFTPFGPQAKINGVGAFDNVSKSRITNDIGSTIDVLFRIDGSGRQRATPAALP